MADGHVDYYGADDYTTSSAAKYAPLAIAETTDIDQFKTELKAHQQGKTDYTTFIEMCAAVGVEKWAVCLEKLTCTYYDKAGGEVLTEKIPE